MKSIILLLSIFILVVFSRTTWDKLDNYNFEQYKAEFHKKYSSSEEEALRKQMVRNIFA